MNVPTQGADGPTAALIQMADIARLAGQSRATVGNWKARKADFPLERGRSNRGPLYDRGEVIAWLRSNDLLPLRQPERGARDAMWEVGNLVRDQGYSRRDVAPFLLLVALAATDAPGALERLRGDGALAFDECVDHLRRELELPAWFTIPKLALQPRALADALEALGTADSQQVATAASDLYGEVGSDRRSRQFALAPSAGSLLVKLASPSGVVYDPAVGDGGLLEQVVSASQSSAAATQLLGDAANAEVASVAVLRLRLAGVLPDIRVADVMERDPRPGLVVDCVVTAPPLGLRSRAIDPADPRWRYGDPKDDGEAAYLQHVVAHLAPAGRGVVVIQPKALHGRGPASRVLHQLLRDDAVDAMVLLPHGMLRSTSIGAAVAVIARERTRRGVAGRPGPVLMVDASDRVVDQDATGIDGLDDVAETYGEWARGGQWHSPDVSTVTQVTYDELATEEFVLDPRRYMVSSIAEADLESLRQQHDRLTAELSTAVRNASVASDGLARALADGGMTCS